MMITGPYITKPVLVPEHTEHVFDPDAYWNLDFDGTELPPGSNLTLLYARVAFPSLAAAQHQHKIERLAIGAQRSGRRRRG
jgi:hypothetical protein